MKPSRRRFLITATFVVATLARNSVANSTEYSDLILKGRQQMAEAERMGASIETHEKFNEVIGRYRNATNTFREAEQMKPSEGEAWFFLGSVDNRIGEVIRNFNSAQCADEKGGPVAFGNALEEISYAKSLGLTTQEQPTLLIELAFAQFHVGRLLEAKRTIEEFISGTDNADLRAKALQLKDDVEKKIKATADAKSKVQICGPAPKPFAVPWSSPAPTCPTEVIQSQYLKSITSGFGYNGNPIPIGNGVSFPPGVSHKDAAFQEASLNLEGDWFFYHEEGGAGLVDKLAASYIGTHDTFFDLSVANTFLQSFGLSYCHCLNETTCAGMDIKDLWMRSDTVNVFNILTVKPNISYAETAELMTQFSYSLIRNDFSMAPKHAFAVLDGFGHQLAIQQTWAHSINDGEWSPDITITAKYLHQWITTDGIVGDKERDNPFIKADWCIFKADDPIAKLRSVNLSGSYEFRHDQFENATFPMINAANRFRRHDNSHLVDIALTCKIGYDEVLKNRLEAVLEYQSTNNDSNVESKTYDQPRVIASLKVNF